MEAQLKRWVEFEKQRLHYCRELQQIRQEQKKLEVSIMKDVPEEKRKKWKAIMTNPGGILRFHEQSQYARISQHMLYDALKAYEAAARPWNAKLVYDYILSERKLRKEWGIEWKQQHKI